MGPLEMLDALNPYERQILDKRPPGRFVGENRATHRARLKNERRRLHAAKEAMMKTNNLQPHYPEKCGTPDAAHVATPVAEQWSCDYCGGNDETPQDHCMDCAGPQAGTWTLTAPDGRTWQADSPLRCVSAEMLERVPASVAVARIWAAVKDKS